MCLLSSRSWLAQFEASSSSALGWEPHRNYTLQRKPLSHTDVANGTTDISTQSWGGGGCGREGERERDRERAVCSQAHGCANINHGDSHGIIKADHSQSQQRRTEEKSTNTNFRPRTCACTAHTHTYFDRINAQQLKVSTVDSQTCCFVRSPGGFCGQREIKSQIC